MMLMPLQRKPRISPVAADAPEMLAIAPVAAQGAKGSAAMATMLRNGPLYDVWRPLARYLNAESMIAVREREILILRVGWLARSEYEWGNHILVGRRAGLTDAEIAAIATGPDDPSWSADEGGLLSAVDDLFHRSKLSDETWQRLSARFSDAELIEIMMIIGHYVMIAFVLNSAEVQREEGVPGF
jgi:alkylhydroperoxidase family enzyme